MLTQTRSRIGLAALLTISVGCGGKGLESIVPNDDPLTLSLSKSTIDYGETVTANWLGRDLVENQPVQQSNFIELDPVLRPTGSTTDTPAVDATYTMRVRHQEQSGTRDVDRSITVHVRPGTKRFLIVGDPNTAQVGAIRGMLPTATTSVADVVNALPDATGAYDAIVLTEGASMSPADRPKIQPWLDGNKGVIVAGRAACLLATGNLTNRDVSAVAGWFGGATRCERGSGYFEQVHRENSLLRLSKTWVTNRIYVAMGSGAKTNASSGMQPFTSSNASGDPSSWSFALPTGRVFFMGILEDNNNDANIRVKDIFIAGARWAAGG